ncbi:ribosome biogenesis GTPase Der [Candidatus Peregrinibacteria bacterium]|nr:ribosome biogenesis GTPase Der [Candidatus Peregrinibacteria bacterium]MBI3816674.1 ribosome biogenesis GTPase Der [Candidatus Peregrinibacteria bacterium]
MSRLPLVAIIGRPNTGKSTLFNRMIGERRAIVSEVPGTTRDHIVRKVETDELDYLLVDTGGMGGGTDDKSFEDDVHAQSLLALEAADVILFTIDGREELTKSDHTIVTILRKNKKRRVPVLLVITKCDNPQAADHLQHEYLGLGIAESIVIVSAFHGLGIAELEESIEKHLRDLHFKKKSQIANRKSQLTRIAVIGKPNVGKSSLINALMSEPQRKISPRLVSDIPGTTRDTTDTVITYHDQEFLFLDTAGLKRHAKTEEGIEHYAMLRTIRALEECDTAIVMLDATQPVSHQDKRIAGMAADAGKGLLILLNKFDLLKSDAKKLTYKEVAAALPFCRFAPVLGVSTLTKDGLLKMFDLLAMIQRNRARRIPTKELHRWYENAVESQPMASLQTAKHITQADEIPPTFVLFVKNPKQVQLSQLRYLENRLRETFDFQGTPVRWVTKSTIRRKMEMSG